MDGPTRARIIQDTKKRYKIEPNPNLLMLCENAAKDIAAKLEHQKRRSPTKSDVDYRAKCVTDAANAIANQNGGVQEASFLVWMVIFLIVMVLLLKYGIDHKYGMEDHVIPGIKSITSDPNK